VRALLPLTRQVLDISRCWGHDLVDGASLSWRLYVVQHTVCTSIISQRFAHAYEATGSSGARVVLAQDTPCMLAELGIILWKETKSKGDGSTRETTSDCDGKPRPLANGLRSLLPAASTAPVVTVGGDYKIGFPWSPRDAKRGFAHLFEHMNVSSSANVSKMRTQADQSSGAFLTGHDSDVTILTTCPFAAWSASVA